MLISCFHSYELQIIFILKDRVTIGDYKFDTFDFVDGVSHFNPKNQKRVCVFKINIMIF
jgi:hypothetical protein